MASTTATVHLILLLVSSGTCGALAAFAFRRRSEPGATPFLGLMVAFALYSAGHMLGLATNHPDWRVLWENVQWVGSAAIPLFWMTFALEYTGHDELLTRRTTALLAAVPAATVLLVWTNPWHGLMWDLQGVVVVQGLAIVEQQFGPGYWVFLAYTYALLTVGSFLLVRLAVLSDYLYGDQMLLLAVGVAVPWLANVLTNFGVTPIRDPNLDITPYGFAISGIAFGHAVFRYRLLDLVPATRQVGRRRAVGDLDDGVLILDTEGRTVYLNPAAADVLDREPAAALGEPASALLDAGALDPDASDALGELEIDGRTHEVRVSPIDDGGDRVIGHTVVLHDVTGRKRRERRLRRQRDELEELAGLNAVIREVNEALVGATTRGEVEGAVAERLAASDRYGGAWVGRGALDRADSIEWTAAVDDRPGADAAAPTASSDGGVSLPGGGDAADPAVVVEPDADDQVTRGGWTTVPITYDRVVYGVLVLYAGGEDPFTDRELAVLDELGGTVGHAINAVESKQLLTTDAVTEVELLCTDPDSAFVALSAGDASVALDGLVPGGDELLAYLTVEGSDAVRERVADVPSVTGVRRLAGSGDEQVVELALSERSLLAALVAHGANVTAVAAADGRCRVTAEVARGTRVRELVERLQGDLPGTELVARRELDRPIDADAFPEDAFEDLTDRQHQALEAAYRAGYFDWPRDSTAEEVAASMDIAPPTLHRHLRLAQNKLLAELLDREG